MGEPEIYPLINFLLEFCISTWCPMFSQCSSKDYIVFWLKLSYHILEQKFFIMMSSSWF